MNTPLIEMLISGWSDHTYRGEYLYKQGLYFIHAADHIKIGISKDVRQRLMGLRASSPIDMQPLGFVPMLDYEALGRCERALHEHFATTRRPGGEWFRDSPELRAFITRHSHPWPPSVLERRRQP